MNEYQYAFDKLSKLTFPDTEQSYELEVRGADYYYELLDTLYDLVEKETPKEPVLIQDDIFGDYHLVCPNCGQGAIVIATRTDGKLYPRCPFCGQKLREEDKNDC
jgi:hypothetical protein